MGGMEQIPDLGDWLTTAPWRDRAVSLIYISPDNGPLCQEHTLAGKRFLVGVAWAAGVLLVAWHGQRRTDVRIVTSEQLGAVADALK